MANLQIFGRTFNDVSSISAYDTSNVKHTFTEGSGVTIEQLNVSAAGTYTAPTGTAYSPVVVPSGSVAVDHVYLQGSDLYMSANVNSSGLVTYTAQYQGYTNATVSSGYVSDFTSGMLEVDASKTYQLPTQSAKTITPSTQQQTAVTAGKYTTGAIKVDPIPSQYIIPTGTVNITSNGTVDVSQYASANVNVSSGITPAPYNDVNFYDYDGTIVYSYSASEFANLSAMPDNPTHDGLIAQGWNWTLSDAKERVAETGVVDIGQMYITDDGKTRLYITISDVNRATPRLYWNQTVSNGVNVDWGDGSSTQTVSGTGNKQLVHTYSSVGDYVISMTVTSGTMKIGGSSTSYPVISTSGSVGVNAYRVMLKKAELGSNASLNTYAFYNCYGLSEVSLCSSSTISAGSFYTCRPLKHITVPSGSTTAYARNCQSLCSISVPKSAVTTPDNAFNACYSLSRYVFSPDVTAINNSALYGCYSICNVIVPAGVTTINASAFYSCNSVSEYHIKPTTPPTLANTNAFTGIPADCKIYVPSASLSAYQAAANWSTYASYMVGE